MAGRNEAVAAFENLHLLIVGLVLEPQFTRHRRAI